MTKLFMDNLALFIPMTLAGLLLVSEVHCGTRVVRTSVRGGAAGGGNIAAADLAVPKGSERLANRPAAARARVR